MACVMCERSGGHGQFSIGTGSMGAQPSGDTYISDLSVSTLARAAGMLYMFTVGLGLGRQRI